MQIVSKRDSFETWYLKTNAIAEEQGIIDNLNTTNKSDFPNAINEVFASFVLPEVVNDTSPSLGDSLYLSNHNIDGTGNINITGSITSTSIAGTVTSVTQSTSDVSTKLATTEYTSLKVASMLSGINLSGDISGSVANLDINPNTINATHINANTFENNNDLQFIGTDGSGQLSFINSTELGVNGGGDISGTPTSLPLMYTINANTVSVNELDLSDSVGVVKLATTNGSAVISFIPSVSFSVTTTSIGQDTFLVTYNIGQIVVYMNGIKLTRGVDFTASNGTEVVLTTPCVDGISTIEFQRFGIV